MAALPEKQLVVSVPVSRTSYQEVVELCSVWAAERKRLRAPLSRYICVLDVRGAVQAHHDPELAAIYREAAVVTPDGMPIVWALRSFGSRNQQRVYGPTLMLKACERAAAEGLRIFLYGGRREMLAVLGLNLVRRFPGLNIAGSYSPPFRPLTESENRDVVQRIRESNVDIVFVGISTPKQERWMYEHRASFPGVTMIGVGAAFDFHSGRTRQAPAWMQRNGLEWLFRLSTEPGRLWKRYLLITPQFLPLWALQKWRLRRSLPQ